VQECKRVELGVSYPVGSVCEVNYIEVSHRTYGLPMNLDTTKLTKKYSQVSGG